MTHKELFFLPGCRGLRSVIPSTGYLPLCLLPPAEPAPERQVSVPFVMSQGALACYTWSSFFFKIPSHVFSPPPPPPPPTAELPPPYTAIASPDAGGVPVINCRVCNSVIHLDGKLHQHVVKCTVCNEATVSRSPPPLFMFHLNSPPPPPIPVPRELVVIKLPVEASRRTNGRFRRTCLHRPCCAPSRLQACFHRTLKPSRRLSQYLFHQR